MKIFIRLTGEEITATQTIKKMVIAASELFFHKITENLMEAELMITDSPVIGANLLSENRTATLAIYLTFSVQDAGAVALARKFRGRVEVCTLFNENQKGRKSLTLYLEEKSTTSCLRNFKPVEK